MQGGDKVKYTIKELRARNNYTQEELAKLAGLNPRTINMYENNIENLRRSSYRNIEKLAEVLKVKVDDIFLG
jgi:transcriptional regulator with XRE-family HTH domain